MTLQTLQTIFSGVSLVSLLLLWWQIRQANRWNRLKTEQTFYSDQSRDLSVHLCRSIERLGIPFRMRREPLTSEEADKIIDDPDGEAFYTAVRYLNDMETMSMAVLSGKADEIIAYETHAARLSYALTIYRPLIQRIQHDFSSTNVFKDMYRLRERWDRLGERMDTIAKRKARVSRFLNDVVDRVLATGTRRRV